MWISAAAAVPLIVLTMGGLAAAIARRRSKRRSTPSTRQDRIQFDIAARQISVASSSDAAHVLAALAKAGYPAVPA
jgi:hypothetical protein